VLVVDAGNALFKTTGPQDELSRQRAALIVEAMAKVGTQALVPGARDLPLGAGYLKQLAKRHGLPVLSANLVDKDGRPVFPASRVVEVGNQKVALIGASPAGQLSDATGQPATAAVKAEAAKLRKGADLVLVLAAVPFADALQLSRELGGQVDFILQSHEGRGPMMAQRAEGNFLVPTGERGRELGRLSVSLQGKGPFVDGDSRERDQRTAQLLDRQIAEVKRRMGEATAEARRGFEQTLQSFERRKQEVQARQQAEQAGRPFKLSFVNLCAELRGDPALEAKVFKLEPPGSEHAH
jgi:2',3'-cyclic-nucleotide 2'-phosphodiesterase (5'-nucleotidase family)